MEKDSKSLQKKTFVTLCGFRRRGRRRKEEGKKEKRK